jgi:hypothetical protein
MANFLNYGEQKQTHPQTHFRHLARENMFRDLHGLCLATDLRSFETEFLCSVWGDESALLRLNFSPPGDDGFQIGATEPKTTRQHFNLLQQSTFNHPPEGRPADT